MRRETRGRTLGVVWMMGEVDPDANGDPEPPVGPSAGFQQDAADLIAPDHDVIGPLHLDLVRRQIGPGEIADGERRDEG